MKTLLPAVDFRDDALRTNRSSGFTLIEMLVVLALILSLAALLLPAIQQAREVARRVMCANQLTQIGIALGNYLAAHDVLPPGTQNDVGPVQSVEAGGYHMSWLAQILPHLEQQNVYDHIDFTKSVYDPRNLSVRQQIIPVFLCPSDNFGGGIPLGFTTYYGVHNDYECPIDVNQNGVLFLNSSIRHDDIEDGTSTTLFVVESRMDMGGNLGWMAGTRSSLRNVVRASIGSPIAGPGDGGTQTLTYGRHSRNPFDTGARPSRNDLSLAKEGSPQFVGGPSSNHSNGILNLLFGDGSVHAISQTIHPNLFRKLAHRADGEMVDEF